MRQLALVTMLGASLGCIAYNLNWIQQRHELLARHTPPTTSDEPRRVGVPPQPEFCTIAPTAKTAGNWLRLLGEPDRSEVKLYLRGEAESRNDEIELAARLFPEAKIVVLLPTRLAIPWVGSMKARMWPAAGDAPH